jgi:hypothetical protein
MKNIFFTIKRSSLVTIQNPDKTKTVFEWSAILFWPPFCFSLSKTGPDISASLDRFVMNKIFFMTLFFFFIKQSRLATIRNPDKSIQISSGPIFKCLGPA